VNFREYKHSGLNKRAKRVVAILLMFMLSFTFLIIPDYTFASTYITVNAVDFNKHVEYYDTYDFTFFNGSFVNVGTSQQISALSTIRNNNDANYSAYVQYISNDSNNVYMSYYNSSVVLTLDVEDIYHKILKTSPDRSFKILPDGTVYDSTSYGYGAYLDVSNRSVSSMAYGGNNITFTINNDLYVSSFPQVPNTKSISIPAGYAVTFTERNNVSVTGGTNFNLNTNYFLGVPPLLDDFNKGTYYIKSSSAPNVGLINFTTLNQLTWDISRSGILNQVSAMQTSINLDADNLTIFNPLMYKYAPTKFIQNGAITIYYSSNKYSAKLYNIITEDNLGFDAVGTEVSEFQPYDPNPDFISDEVVEIVDTTDPDYIDTTSPDYEFPDPEDPDYIASPTLPGVTPPPGGAVGGQLPGTYVPGSDSEEGFFEIISEAINNLKQTIINLFAPAAGAITQLISAGSSFMQSVASMFLWLPADLVSVITSGLILLVVIGTLKMLL
jgi:hypothetical protein